MTRKFRQVSNYKYVDNCWEAIIFKKVCLGKCVYTCLDEYRQEWKS